MIYLFLSILSSSLIYTVLKLLDNYNINRVYAISINYLAACILGFFLQRQSVSVGEIISRDWFWGACLLGLLFIGIFILMAITTKKSGLSVVSVAAKMSVAISVLFVIIYYREPLTILKVIGIALALLAVYLVSIKTKSGLHIKKENLIFPALVLFGSGLQDIIIKFAQQDYVAKNETAIFSATIFGAAFVVGAIQGGNQLLRKKIAFRGKDLIGGICLGIPNYFSIYFFIKALDYSGLKTSTVFIFNNVSIVMLSTILGILFFKEKLLAKNWVGIALAVLSIILITITTT